MLASLKKYDPRLVELSTPDGGVLVSPGLQGRIFCHVKGELVHRLDASLLANPVPSVFNNLGGNSLWPAPEGGQYAFNYLPGSDEWLVQAGIADVNPEVTHQDAGRAVTVKTVSLSNRQGNVVEVTITRSVASIDVSEELADFALNAVAYESKDRFDPQGRYLPEDVLLAPWSLEQFPNAKSSIAFAIVENPAVAINFDFYDDPKQWIFYGSDCFAFVLGNGTRQQIGIKASHRPTLIGALDRARSLLVLRTTPVRTETYFNIADNHQKDGPYSAADCYSIFNTGELDFYELETIAPLQTRDGILTSNTLLSQTVILQGSLEELNRYLSARKGIDLNHVLP